MPLKWNNKERKEEKKGKWIPSTLKAFYFVHCAESWIIKFNLKAQGKSLWSAQDDEGWNKSNNKDP